MTVSQLEMTVASKQWQDGGSSQMMPPITGLLLEELALNCPSKGRIGAVKDDHG